MGQIPCYGQPPQGRFLLGMGVSVVFVAILKLTSQWFYDRQFATMTGLTIFLRNIGGLTAATPLAWALEVSSWRSIVIFLGVVSLLCQRHYFICSEGFTADAGFLQCVAKGNSII